MIKNRNQMVRYLLATLMLAFALTGCGQEIKQPKIIENNNIPESTSRVENSPVAMEEPALNISETPDVSEAPIASAVIPDDSDLVRVLDYIPSIYTDLKYATTDNFTGEVIYNFSDAFLRYGTIKKLAVVQEELEAQGYSLKIWDAYRPVSAQFKLWELYPDPVYVANPNTGYSSHSRGNTVDVTLVLLDGSEIEMPTGFDDFSDMADRDYSDVPEEAANNALLLENAMISNGFSGYSGEWWHFSDSVSYSVIENE